MPAAMPGDQRRHAQRARAMPRRGIRAGAAIALALCPARPPMSRSPVEAATRTYSDLIDAAPFIVSLQQVRWRPSRLAGCLTVLPFAVLSRHLPARTPPAFIFHAPVAAASTHARRDCRRAPCRGRRHVYRRVYLLRAARAESVDARHERSFRTTRQRSGDGTACRLARLRVLFVRAQCERS